MGNTATLRWQNFFHKIDTDESGFIDKIEFKEFVTLATKDESNRKREAWLQEARAKSKLDNKSTVQVFRSSLISAGTLDINITEHTVGSDNHRFTHTGRSNSVLGGEETINYIKTIANNTNGSGNPLEDWSVFYCGGSNNIKANLKDISRRYGIDFAVEKFDW